MTKPIPSNDPHYYAILSDAVYKKDKEASQDYIQKSYPDAQVLEEKTVLFLWKFMLVKRGDELAVVFRGIRPDEGWINYIVEGIPAAFDQIGAPIPLIKGMEDHINFWQMKYGKIEVLTGHSKGGYFASRVMLCADLFRITFNGQYVLKGEKNINFRTKSDWIYNGHLSDKNLSICIGPGDHEIIFSIHNLVGKKWSDISSIFKIPQQAISNTPSNSFSGLELVSTRHQLLTDSQTVRQLLQANEDATLYGRVQLFSADGYPLYPLSPFGPNLCSLSPSPMALSYYMGQIDPEILSRCSLPWEATYNPRTDVQTLSTFLETPHDKLAQVEELPTFDWDPSLPVIIPLPRSSESSEREKPGFLERSRIIGIREGETRIGGRGLIFGLACGTEVSIAAVDNKYITGISIPFTSNLLSGLSSLGSGLMYAAPVAAIIFAIYKTTKIHEKRFYAHINNDYKETTKDVNEINDSLQQFNTVLDEFSQGRINKEAFLAKINDLHEQIHSASKEMSRRGRYLDKHRDCKTTEGGRAFLTHFASKTKLRQIDRDLQTIADAVIAQRETQDHDIPKFKERPFTVLCDNLQALFNKGVLSINEKYQQEALIQEISARVEYENIEALSRLDGLTNRPIAISLQPEGIAKPMHLSGKHLIGTNSSKKRRAERIKDWANSLDSAYQHFREVALTGDVEEMEKAAQAVFHQIGRASGEGDVNLHKYKMWVANPESDHYFRKTKAYYNNYTTAIENNTHATLAKARAAKAGTITQDSPVLFTSDELQSLKAEAAINSFNAALSSFQIGEEADKDTAFGQMYDAAQVLDTLKHQSESEEENQLVQSTLSIGNEYGTYSNYQKTNSHLKSIQDELETFQTALEKTKAPRIKSKEQAKQYKLAYESAARLKELGLVEEDVAKLIDNPESISLVLSNVNLVYNDYPDYVRVGRYEDTVLPIFSAPLIRFGLHVLNDFQQYENHSGLKPYTWGLSTFHAIAPQALPNLVNLGLACVGGENSAVVYGLGEKIWKGVKANVFTTVASFVYSPLQTYNKTNSLSKGTSLVSNTSTALQFVAAIVSLFTTRAFGESGRVQTFNTAVTGIPSNLSTVSNALFYANILNKTSRYLQAGTLTLKLHKVSQGLAGLVLAGFDLYEISATDPSELTNSNCLTKLLKKCLPTYHGRLPENKTYYEKKDVLVLAVTTVGCGLSKNVIVGGLAAWQVVNMIYNTYSGGYTDNALSSILANYRYQIRQDSTDERNRALANALENLAEHFGGNFRIDKQTDSPVKQQAKLFYFERNVDKLEEKVERVVNKLEKKAAWTALIEETSIIFEDNIYKFKSVNLHVFDAVNVLFKHYSAVSQSSVHIRQKIDEIEKLSQYFDRKSSELPDPEKKKTNDSIKNTKENLQRIKIKLLSNFGIFYVKDELKSDPWVVLGMFDAIPNAYRDLVDWYVFGSLVCELRTQSEDPKSFRMIAVERFCFETVVDMLDKKQGVLSDFEKDLHHRSQNMLAYLARTLPEDYIGIDLTETQNFSQVIRDLLLPTPRSASLLNSKHQNWE